MAEKNLATRGIKYLQILDENGNVDQALMPKISSDQIRRIYELMVTLRIFDETALKLQREGRMLTFASARGQEAQVVAVLPLTKDDWVATSFRENGVMIAGGYPMEMLYQYWGGDERGMRIPDGLKFMPAAIPVASQILHAVGLAWAEKLRSTKNLAISFSGDGSTSKGDFHEGLNIAGVFKLPYIAFIQNNQWAISEPRSKQTASETLAQKAIAYGFDGVQVDGNDVFAVYKAVADAAAKARSGGGPTLIEMYTYRIESHTTADEWQKYRDPKEVEEWKKKDPVDRLEKYMARIGLLNDSSKKQIWDDVQAMVNEAVRKMESVEPPKAGEMFDYVYEKLTSNLVEQKQSVVGK